MSREKFEEWAIYGLPRGFNPLRAPGESDYATFRTNAAWHAWQASRRVALEDVIAFHKAQEDGFIDAMVEARSAGNDMIAGEWATHAASHVSSAEKIRALMEGE